MSNDVNCRRETKYLQINSQVIQLGDILDKLNKLYLKIISSPKYEVVNTESEKCEEKKVPSLNDFLNFAPEQLEKTITELLDLIDCIDKSLFFD